MSSLKLPHTIQNTYNKQHKLWDYSHCIGTNPDIGLPDIGLLSGIGLTPASDRIGHRAHPDIGLASASGLPQYIHNITYIINT